jgi:hypothetical protein
MQKSGERVNPLMQRNLESRTDFMGDNDDSASGQDMPEEAYRNMKGSETPTPGHRVVTKAVTATKLPTFKEQKAMDTEESERNKDDTLSGEHDVSPRETNYTPEIYKRVVSKNDHIKFSDLHLQNKPSTSSKKENSQMLDLQASLVNPYMINKRTASSRIIEELSH